MRTRKSLREVELDRQLRLEAHRQLVAKRRREKQRVRDQKALQEDAKRRVRAKERAEVERHREESRRLLREAKVTARKQRLEQLKQLHPPRIPRGKRYHIGYPAVQGRRTRSRHDGVLRDTSVRVRPLYDGDYWPTIALPNGEHEVSLRQSWNWSTYETMTDVVGHRNEINACVHQKAGVHFFSNVPSLGLPFRGRVTNGNWVDYMRLVPATWDISPEDFNVGLGVTRDQMGDFAWDSFWNATTQIKEEDNIVNFLLELGDIRHIFNFLKDKWFQAITNGFLTFKFGIEPFYHDLVTFAGVFQKVRDRLVFLRKTSGKTYTVRYHRVVPLPGSLSGDIEFLAHSGDPDPSIWYGRAKAARMIDSEVVMSSTIVVKNELRRLNDTLTFFNAMSAALGLSNPVRTYWNSIPLSFVFEWFVHMDNVFKQLTHEYGGGAPFPGELTVISQCFSVKQRRLFDVVADIPYTTTLDERFLSNEVNVGVASSIQYMRQNGLPFNNMVHLNDVISPIQRNLIAALLAQKVSGGERKYISTNVKTSRKSIRRRKRTVRAR